MTVYACPKPESKRHVGLLVRVNKSDGQRVEICLDEDTWAQRREECYRRDRGLCVSCGEIAPLRKAEMATPGRMSTITLAGEADHINARKAGGGSRNDALDNLRWLCARCHRLLTDGKLVLPSYPIYHGYDSYGALAESYGYEYDSIRNMYRKREWRADWREYALLEFMPQHRIIFAASADVTCDGLPLVVVKSTLANEYAYIHGVEWPAHNSLGARYAESLSTLGLTMLTPEATRAWEALHQHLRATGKHSYVVACPTCKSILVYRLTIDQLERTQAEQIGGCVYCSADSLPEFMRRGFAGCR